MITMQWWELILACLCWQVTYALTSAVVRDFRRTCPERPDHGRVR